MKHGDEEINFDNFWIDYLEDEIDPKLKPDFKQLLSISKESRETLKEYHWLGELVATVDPAHDEHLAKWDQKQTRDDIMETCHQLEESKAKAMNPRY